jgi:hypothetical protein
MSTATLERRLRDLEASPPPPEPPDEATQFARWWESLPVPIQQYLNAIGERMAADPAYPRDESPDAEYHRSRWMEQHTPSWNSALEALTAATYEGFTGPAVLRCVQGYGLLRLGVWRLGWALAHERRRPGHAVMMTSPTFEEAAALLAGVEGRLEGAWHDRTGDLWMRVWREHGNRDPRILRMAGLHEPELALLDATEEDEDQ